MELLDRVSRYAAQHRLWTREARIVAAVSGGSDSVALLFLLRELAARGELMLAGLAHLNHHIRGAAADADAAFCRALAARLEIPAFLGDADVPALAAHEGASLELAGRHARQRFFNEVLTSGKAQRVAVAHTRDDQAETVVLRLTRGAGAAGLAGMAPRRGQLVRPALELTRQELQEYLRHRGETWREDATNLDRSVPRNLIRHEVLPILRTMNAQADAALARAADALRVDAELLETLANAAYLQVVKSASARELPSELRRDLADLSAGASAKAEAASSREGGTGSDDNTVIVSPGELTKLPVALATRV
ncbi:MAG: tRNA lysidine(34) synthetase TilS, partial [Vicinamibacterales bacterium]